MLTHKWRKALLIVALTLFALAASAGWFLVRHTMNVARAFEVNDSRSSPHVLIATQGSEFKDAVVAGLIDDLKSRNAYVKVIDISSLPGVDARDWNAVVILHTWQVGRPPPEVTAFLDRSGERRRIVALTTSGGGDMKIEGIDAISSASRMLDVPLRVNEILHEIDAILRTQ